MILAPAMNTAMWEHPLTGQQLSTIQSFWTPLSAGDGTACGVSIVRPQSKVLACGEIGVGALADIDTILQSVRRAIVEHGIAQR